VRGIHHIFGPFEGNEGEFVAIIEFDGKEEMGRIVQYNKLDKELSSFSNSEKAWVLSFLYTYACDLLEELKEVCMLERKWLRCAWQLIPGFLMEKLEKDSGGKEKDDTGAVTCMKEEITPQGVVAKKKYKPVAKKVKLVVTTLPGQYRIVREIKGDPLEKMPELARVPPKFKLMGRYMAERKEVVEKNHKGFLWPEEITLMHHFMCLQNEGFTWSDLERGTFHLDFFPPIDFPVVPHVPFIERNMPIPPGIYEEVCRIIKKKLAAGVYEPSNTPYRTRWFCVEKG
jgi:hypothetical protein